MPNDLPDQVFIMLPARRRHTFRRIVAMLAAMDDNTVAIFSASSKSARELIRHVVSVLAVDIGISNAAISLWEHFNVDGVNRMARHVSTNLLAATSPPELPRFTLSLTEQKKERYRRAKPQEKENSGYRTQAHRIMNKQIHNKQGPRGKTKKRQ